MASDGDRGDDAYRQARIGAALMLIGLVILRGILDVIVPGFDVSDTYGAILLGAALVLLGLATWRP